MKKPISEVAKELKSTLKHASCGPLVAALLIEQLAADWRDHYQAQAEGVDLSTWLVQNVTMNTSKGVAWFQARAAAVRAIGRHAPRMWDHQAAVWAYGAFSKDPVALDKLDRAVLRGQIRDGKPAEDAPAVPTLGQVKKMARDLGLYRAVSRPRKCANCRVLEAELAVFRSMKPGGGNNNSTPEVA